MNHRLSSLPILALYVLLAVAPAADWPLWRYDAGHSGASPENLPDELSLRWVRQLPPPSPAWPNEPRLHFDASNEPIVLGKTLFVGSALEGSVTAFDTDTGSQRWKFFADGPVRLPTVAWRNHVYAGSDDGWLYCLDAATGAPQWKVRGAPEERADFHHLGNGRLISYWPVRGGPVVADGVVYFAAGFWPTLGVFITACDAATGRVLWSNRESHRMENVVIDHDVLKEAALAPQGSLAIAGEKLLVPNGRCLPAALDRRTGKPIWFRQGYRNGDCRIAVAGPLAFVGEGGVINLEDGRELGSTLFETAATHAGLDGKRPKPVAGESPIFPYKRFPGCDARSVFEGDVSYGNADGAFFAYDLTNTTRSYYESPNPSVTKHKPASWEAPLRWKLAAEGAAKKNATKAGAATTAAASTLIKAGRRLYGHDGRTLVAVAVPDKGGEPKIVWRHDLDAVPSSLIAADGKLFVATQDGRLFCFGEGRASPVTHTAPAKPAEPAADRWTKHAADALARAGVSEGYALVLGIGSGRLAEELLRQSQMRVIAVDPDAEKVRQLRDRLVAASHYGQRAEVFVGAPTEFRFPPCLASLVVSEDAPAAGLSGPGWREKVLQVLRPYGGTAFLDPASPSGVLRRDGPLPGSASWTHETADAARSFMSQDQLVKPPLGILWYGDGADYGFLKRKDYDTGVKPQGVGGRMIALSGEFLQAVDVYTGRSMWKSKVPNRIRYASMPDAIYVAASGKCLVLDPATGRTRETWTWEGGEANAVIDICVSERIVMIAATSPSKLGLAPSKDGRLLVALDRSTGRLLWSRKPAGVISRNAIAMGAGLVFCTDSPPLGKDKTNSTVDSTVLALDEMIGKVAWQSVITTPPDANLVSIRPNDNWVAYAAASDIVLAGMGNQKFAFAAKTGKDVWRKTVAGHPPMMLRDDTFIAQDGHEYDLRTGERRSQKSLFTRWGCNYAVASQALVLVRDSSASYVDVATGEHCHLRNVRSGCSNSYVAADGVVTVPCFSAGCVCNYPIQTVYTLIHMPEVGEWDRHP